MNTHSNHSQSAALKRVSNKQWVLKPQDLAMAFKLVVLDGRWQPYAVLAQSMHLSPYEAHAAIQRLFAAGLVVELDNKPVPVMMALHQFVLYGARYAYPPVRLGATIGFPTSMDAPVFEDQREDHPPVTWVWPHPEGIAKGQALLPLYEKLPLAAVANPRLYELLAAFDALRVGQARESASASKILEQRLR